MANIKISALPLASPITGVELVPIVQGATTKKTTVNDIKDYINSVGGYITGAGTAGKIPVFTAGSILGNSYLEQISNGVVLSLNQSAATSLLHVYNPNATTGGARASLRSQSNSVVAEVLSITGVGAYVGTSSNHRLALMVNGTEYFGINATNGRIQTNQAPDTNESFIVGGSLRANGQITSTNVASAFRLLSGANTLFSIGYSGGTLFDRLTGTSFFIAENGTPQLTIASGGVVTFANIVKLKDGSGLTFENTGDVGMYYSGGIVFAYNNIGSWRFSTDTNTNAFELSGSGNATFSGIVNSKGLFSTKDGENLRLQAETANQSIFHAYYNSVGARRAFIGFGASGNNVFNFFSDEPSTKFYFNRTIVVETTIEITTAPATSAASYDILTRNTVTGVIEKVASSVLGISGSGATGLIPVFTGATSIGNSMMSQTGSVLLINGEVRIVTVEEQPAGFYKNLVHDSTTNYVHEVAINSFERTPIADTNYTTSAQDNLIAYTALTAQRTVSLRPPATSLGTSERPVFVAVKDESGQAGTHNIRVDVSGGGNIDGSPTQTISTSYGSIWFYCDGTKWSVYTRI